MYCLDLPPGLEDLLVIMFVVDPYYRSSLFQRKLFLESQNMFKNQQKLNWRTLAKRSMNFSVQKYTHAIFSFLFLGFLFFRGKFRRQSLHCQGAISEKFENIAP
jgi:hypothetical protein